MTFPQVNNLCRVTAFLHNNNAFLGCAVIFKNNESIMLATAFHVISKTTTGFLETIYDIKVLDERGREYSISDYCGSLDECHKRDIALFTLHGDCSDLQEVLFLDPLIDPRINLISRCKNRKMKYAQAIYSKELIERVDDFSYLINVDKAILQNEDGYWGADALAGISGAGVFIKINQHLVIVGVISSIPDCGLMGKIKCCNSACFLQANSELPTYVYNDEKYNYGLGIVDSAVKELESKNMDSVLAEWENDPINKEYNDNISRKLKAFHREDKFKKEKRKIISNLLDGNIFINENIRSLPEVQKAYFFAHHVFCNEDMTVNANGRVEAKSKYDSIKEDYLDSLYSALEPLGINKSEIRLLRNRDIASWLAMCDLDFIGEDDD